MFFDFSWSEIIVVMVVALIVIGPKEIPGAMRALGRIVGKLRRTADEFRRHFDDTVREAGGEDLQRELQELRDNNPLNEIRNTVENAAREITNPAPLKIGEPSSSGQPQTNAQTAAGDTKASSTSTSASKPEQAPDSTAPTGPANAPESEVSKKDAAPTSDGAPTDGDKPTHK